MPASIFDPSNSGEIKTLRDGLNLNGKMKILNGSDDPTVVAKDAPAGSIYCNTSTGAIYKKLDAGSTTNWELLGAGSGGSKSWLTGNNSNFETGIGDWEIVTNTTPAATPEVSPGGTNSGNLTIERTTTSGEVLAGDASLAIRKAGTANLQGEMIQVPFTIDVCEQGVMQQLPFKIKTGSGYVNEHYRVFVRDVTNSEILNVQTGENNSGKIYATGSNGSPFTGWFLPNSDSTSYELIIHSTSTDTTNFDIFIDEVKPGPISTVSAYNSEPIEAFTPNYTGAVTLNTDVAYKWRDGEFMKMLIRLSYSSGSGGSTAFEMTIPDGKSYKTVGSQSGTYRPLVGGGYMFNTGTQEPIVPSYNSSSGKIAFAEADSTTNEYMVDSDIGSAFTMWCYIEIPIEGWEDSDTMSTHRADFNNLLAVYDITASTANSSIAATTVETLDYDSKVIDTHNCVTTGASWQFEAPRSMWYIIEASATINATTGKIFDIRAQSTSETFLLNRIPGLSSDVITPSGVKSVYLEKGETLRADFYNGDSSPQSISTSAGQGRITIRADILKNIAFGINGIDERKKSSSALAAYSITAGQWGDLTSLTLSPGDWNLEAQEIFNANGAITTTQVSIGISTTSGNSSTGLVTGDNAMFTQPETASGKLTPLWLNSYRVTITEETTFYLKSKADTSISNLQVAYKFTAERRK